MKAEKTKAYVKSLVEKKGLPLFDVCVYKNHEHLFRFYTGTLPVNGKETVFLYSASKPMTVVGALRLVDAGKLSLDDKVSKYLPNYENAFLLDEKGNRVSLKREMTVRHLFTMTAGLTYCLQTPSILAVKERLNGQGTTLDFVNAFVGEPLSFEPGERFQYSLCHDVLAGVVEVASGMRFSEYMEKEIFAPLGMQGTGFHLEKEKELFPQFTGVNGVVEPCETTNALVFGDEYDSGGAGVVGCVDDYIRFADALACGGEAKNGYRLLNESTVETMRTEQLENITVENAYTCVQGDDYGYGLGVRTRMKDTEWGLEKGEFGWDGAAGFYLLVDPKNKISIVMNTHVLSWPNVIGGEHLEIVRCIYEDMQTEGLL